MRMLIAAYVNGFGSFTPHYYICYYLPGVSNSKIYKEKEHIISMKNGLVKTLLLAGAIGLGSTGCSMGQDIKLRGNSEVLPAPIYQEYKQNSCAAYAVRTARDHFGKPFHYENAWNLRHSKNHEIVAKVEDNNHFKQLIANGTVEPGMIVGIYYPFSSYLNHKDKTGEQVAYTHLAVFAGVNQKGEPTFYHQFKERTESITLSDLTWGLGSKIREVLDVKGH